MKKKVEKNNVPAIDSKELIIAMEELEKEKGINKDYLLEIKYPSCCVRHN